MIVLGATVSSPRKCQHATFSNYFVVLRRISKISRFSILQNDVTLSDHGFLIDNTKYNGAELENIVPKVKTWWVGSSYSEGSADSRFFWYRRLPRGGSPLVLEGCGRYLQYVLDIHLAEDVNVQCM